MDESEKSKDIFTVSVGNLPPQTEVLIKITYITELPLFGEDIIFTIPCIFIIFNFYFINFYFYFLLLLFFNNLI